MEITAQEYQRLVKRSAPRSSVMGDCLRAFLIGGGICALGQVLTTVYEGLRVDKETASLLCTISLIFLSAFLTGAGLYNKIAKYAGAGTLVPITGFANAIASAATEFKTEGMVLGLGAKMFTIAGPVIVYGVVASVVYGLIYWLVLMI